MDKKLVFIMFILILLNFAYTAYVHYEFVTWREEALEFLRTVWYLLEEIYAEIN